MKPRWVIARRELGGIFTERTILLAVVIQVIVAGFSSFLVVGLSALVDPSAFPSQAQARVVLDPDAAADGALREHLRQAGLDHFSASDDARAFQAFRTGEADAAIFLVPPGEGVDPSRAPVNLTILLPESDIRTTLTLVQLKAALESYEMSLREQRMERLQFTPLHLETDAKGGSYAFVYSLLIPLLVFLPVVLAGALCADSLTEEVQRKTLPLLLASPATPADVVEGKLLANVAIAPLLGVAWLLLLGVNDLPVPILGALGILVLATAFAYVMGLLACGIALATRDRNKAHVIYAAVMFFGLGASMALPVNPVNAVALLAAGSAHAGVWAFVAGAVAVCLAGWIGLRVLLRRSAQWMAAGVA